MKVSNILKSAVLAGAAVSACGNEPEGFDPGPGFNPGEKPIIKEEEDPEEPGDSLIVFPERPNVIVILADDLGYSDVGCYGSEISTPGIDRLAETGIRYRTFYNAARSAPTRASLLTGLYPHQAGVGALNEVPGYEHYLGYLRDDTNTIPESLKSAGYTSFITGKWHLQQAHCKPIERGFDHSLFFGGGWYWSNDKVNTSQLFFEDKAIPNNSGKLPGGASTWYTSDMFVTVGLNWVDEAVNAGKPFFWYMPFNAVHFPIQSKPETIAKYTGKYSEGYSAIRNRRFAKQVSMGLFKQGELSPENPHSNFKTWDKMTDADKVRADKQMAVYAACVENMDENILRIINHLEEKGIRDNTLIIFLSDNGGNAESGWPGTFQHNSTDYPGDPGAAGSNCWLGAPWAGVANTPYFLYKRHAHNGGCCTPLIFSWPAAIDKSLWGTIDKDSYGHLIDLMPTILEVTGGSYPEYHTTKNGTRVKAVPMEGTSLTPSFRGQAVTRTKPIIVEHEGAKMLRDGDWKIVREFEFTSGGRSGNKESTETQNPWRLYNVANDPSELHDLSGQFPSRVNQMVSTYKSEAARICVDSDLLWTVGLWYTPVRNFPPVN